MAVYNEILAGRFNRGLQKLFGIKGPPPVPQLSSEVMSVHRIESGVENRYLEGWNRFSTSVTVPAAVGNASGVRLRNPTGSGVVIVVEKIEIGLGSIQSDLTTSGATNSDLTTLVGVANTRMDPRGNPAPVAILSQQNTTATIGALPTGISNQFVLANTMYNTINNPNQEVPLLPGDALQLVGTNTNQAVGVTLEWRERVLEDSEKT